MLESEKKAESGAPNVQTRAGQEKMKEMGVKPVPLPDDVSRPYWEAAKKRELRIQQCKACSEYQHPPREECLQCGKTEFDWPQLSGKGTVFSFIIDRRLMTPGFDEPYVVAQINPVETQNDVVRITTNVRDCELGDVYCDMPVEILFEDVTDAVTLPQFRPTADAKLKSKGQNPS
jgi:uncharacterized OB-fold protein